MKKMEAESETINSTRSIPHDLVTDILSRLPVNSLCRFRCVSVQWNRTISDRTFAKSQYNHSLSRSDGTSLILTFPDNFYVARTIYAVDHRENDDPVAVNMLIVFGFVHHFVSESLDGLICLELGSSFKICNPSTREIITLPKRETDTTVPPSYCYSGSKFFGYDPINNEHKVLSTCVMCGREDGRDKIIMENKVFVIGDASWRRISDSPPHCPHSKGVCVSGVLYYRAWTCIMGILNQEVVIAFDVHLETFRCIQMPSGKLHLYNESGLIQYDGRVAIIDYQGLKYWNRIQIWVLEDDSVKPKWIHKIIFLSSISTDIRGERVFYLAGTLHSGEIIMAPRDLSKPFYLFYLNLKSANARRVEIRCMPDYELRFSGAYRNITATDHVESILSLSSLHDH